MSRIQRALNEFPPAHFAPRSFRFSTRAWAVFACLPLALALAGRSPNASAADSNPASPRELAVGDTVENEVVTPIALAVLNPEKTDAQRQAELPKVPPVFRRDPSRRTTAETELQNRFIATRESFLDLIAARFHQRTLRSVADLNDVRFSETIALFHAKRSGFPLSTNLAELWALGDDGRVVLGDLTSQLRRFMTANVCPDRLPDDERSTATTIRILPANTETASDGAIVPRANLFSLSRYRRDLADLASPEDRPVIEFIASFLQPTCVFDEAATRQARQERANAIGVLDHYAAGDRIARRGDRVDARQKLALDALRTNELARSGRDVESARLRADRDPARDEASQLRSAAQLERQRAESITAAQRDIVAAETQDRRVGVALAVAAGAFILFLGWWWRHRQRQRRLARSADWAVLATDGTANEAGLWRERALAAEARAEKATAMLRANLLPQMARWMMSELLQRLLSQRTAAQSNAQQAEVEVAELASRLEKLQAPMEERRRAYENRIAELEAELAARDQHDHELIQARIESTRRRLQADRPGEGTWN